MGKPKVKLLQISRYELNYVDNLYAGYHSIHLPRVKKIQCEASLLAVPKRQTIRSRMLNSYGCALLSLLLAAGLGGPLPFPDMLPFRDPPLEPSRASRSRKSDHSSAKLSLLPLEPRCSSCDSAAADKDGVLGVRRKGDMGTRRDGAVVDVEAPGRASPACSFCSVASVSYANSKKAQRKMSVPSFQASRAAISCRT